MAGSPSTVNTTKDIRLRIAKLEGEINVKLSILWHGLGWACGGADPSLDFLSVRCSIRLGRAVRVFRKLPLGLGERLFG